MKVLVAGSTGLAGRSVSSLLKGNGFEVLDSNRNVVNFLDSQATSDFIHDLRPDVIIDAAAKVGGISFNNEFPVDSLTENLLIQINLMKAALEANVPKFCVPRI